MQVINCSIKMLNVKVNYKMRKVTKWGTSEKHHWGGYKDWHEK